MGQKASPERELSNACFGCIQRRPFLKILIKIQVISEINRSERKPRPGTSTVQFWQNFNGILDSLEGGLSNGRIQVQWDQESRERACFDILRKSKKSLLRRIGFSVRPQLVAASKISELPFFYYDTMETKQARSSTIMQRMQYSANERYFTIIS